MSARRHSRSPVRALALGLGAAAVYLIAAGAGSPPMRPLYDGFLPPSPYRWVNPPKAFSQGNEKPGSAVHDVDLTAEGSVAAQSATSDGQAGVVLKPGAFAPKAGETKVVLTIEPLDPGTLGSPPDGLSYDGNAYTFKAVYGKSRTDAPLTSPATIVIRYPIFATKLLRHDATGLVDVNATPVPASLTVFGDSTALGTFVAAGPLGEAPKTPGASGSRTILIVSLALGAAALGAAVGLRARRKAVRGKRRPAATARVTKPKRRR